MGDAALAPPPELRFRRRIRMLHAIREAWRSRELIGTLAEREVRARYKQAILGLAWALVTPLALMLVFTLFIGRIARVDTGGAPYPLFAYLGLLPWTFFSSSINHGGQSLVQNVSLLNKVYFPREVFPLSSLVVAGLDFAVALMPLVGLFLLFGVLPKPTAYWIPLLLLVQFAFTLGATLLTSAVIVYLRDLRHALPILLQLGLFATPVAYGIEAVPEGARLVYSIVNPLAPIIDGYRRALLFGLPPSWDLLIPGAVSSLVLLLGGYWIFKRLEAGFADVA